jgi:hypothetical protein
MFLYWLLFIIIQYVDKDNTKYFTKFLMHKGQNITLVFEKFKCLIIFLLRTCNKIFIFKFQPHFKFEFHYFV